MITTINNDRHLGMYRDFFLGNNRFILFLKGRSNMGTHKKVSRPKSPVTVQDPHYTEYDIQKERNIQTPHKVSHK